VSVRLRSRQRMDDMPDDTAYLVAFKAESMESRQEGIQWPRERGAVHVLADVWLLKDLIDGLAMSGTRSNDGRISTVLSSSSSCRLGLIGVIKSSAPSSRLDCRQPRQIGRFSNSGRKYSVSTDTGHQSCAQRRLRFLLGSFATVKASHPSRPASPPMKVVEPKFWYDPARPQWRPRRHILSQIVI